MELIYTDKDGNQTKYTQDMLTAALDERNKLRLDVDELRDKANKYWLERVQLQDKVYQFFNERYDSGDADISCDVDDINDLLESIGSEKLKSLFTVSGTISFTVTDIEAESEEEARELVETELAVDFSNGSGSVDDWDVEVRHTSRQ